MTDNQLPELITVGKLGKVYGLKGWLRLISYTQPQANVFDYAPWYLYQRQQWQPCEMAAHQRHAGGWIVKLAGCDDRDQASQLVNAHIGVPKASLPACAPDEFYWHDLIGLRVENTQGQQLGTITDFIETGANDVMVVTDPTQSHEQWVPYVKDVIVNVDLAKGCLHVDWDKDT